MQENRKQIKEIGSVLAQELGCSEDVAQKVLSIMFDYSAQTAIAEIKRQEAAKTNAKIMSVRKILRNYNRIKESVDCAVDCAVDLLDDTEIQRLMQREENVKNQQVLALALQAGKSRVLLAQVDAALATLKRISEASHHPGQQRQYALICKKYIEQIPIQNILEEFHIERTVYYENVRAAESALAILIFGADTAKETMEQSA